MNNHACELSTLLVAEKSINHSILYVILCCIMLYYVILCYFVILYSIKHDVPVFDADVRLDKLELLGDALTLEAATFKISNNWRKHFIK